MVRRRIEISIELIVLLIGAALIAGQILGQPVLLGYVTSGSMEPTIETGEGFVAIPAVLMGPVEEGDVIVFDAAVLRGGGLVTHRVVDETDRGYITKGDANPFTDQQGQEPPVKDAQVVGKVWQPGGEVVTIPRLGAAVVTVQRVFERVPRVLATTFGTRALLGPAGLAYLLFGLSSLFFGLDWYFARNTNQKERNRSTKRNSGVSTRLVLAGFAVVVMSAATGAMIAPSGNQEIGIVSSQFESDNPTVIPQGTSNEVPYLVPNVGLVPVHVYVEPASEGIDSDPNHLFVGARDEASVTLTLEAPDETGYYRRFVSEHRYLALLPEPVINELYEVHPWVPIVAINALLGGGFYTLGLAALGLAPARVRQRNRPYSPSLTARLKGVLY